MRLIDADALVFKNCNGNIEYNRGVEDCVDMVMSAQTVQAVPIDALDKIRAELHATAEMHEDGDYYLREKWIDEIFDKYKTESEDK